MEPADMFQCGPTPESQAHYAPGHVRKAKQLVIDLPPETVDVEKFTCDNCGGRKRHFMRESLDPDNATLTEVFGCPTCDE